MMSGNEDKTGVIDILRLFFSVYITASHTLYFNCVGEYNILAVLSNVFRYPVPFFFVASGFFAFRKMEGYYGENNNLARLKFIINRMIRRYIVWSILGLPFAIFEFIYWKTGFVMAFFLYCRDFVFRGEHYLGAPTWYLLSSIYALILIYCVLKMSNSEKNIFYLISISLLVYYIIKPGSVFEKIICENKICNLIYINSVGMYGSRLFRGIWLISVGMLLAKYLKTENKLIIISCSILLELISLMYNNEVSEMVGAVALFTIAYCIPLSVSRISIWVRRMSAVVYYTHMFFVPLYLYIYDGKYSGGVFYCTIFSSILVGIVINICIDNNILKKWFLLLV